MCLTASAVRRNVGGAWSRKGALLACLLVLAGCRTELLSDLDQRQANEVIATLARGGIPSERRAGEKGRFTVTVEKSQFPDAVRILDDNGLPRHEFATLGQVFKKEGLIASPVQERAQMIFALSQELSQTISDIDGVVTARVHLVLPENDPMRQQLVPSSASVFVRHRTNAAINDLVPQIKQLVAYGVAGLAYDKVSVILVPVEAVAQSAASEPAFASFMGLWVHPDSAAWVAMVIYGLAAAVIVLLGLVLWLALGQRHRVYTLAPSARAES
jgi:type III secretion protein J